MSWDSLADRIIRRLQRWMLFPLRWDRRPGCRRMLKAYGWLLFVTGVLPMTLPVPTRRY